MLCIPVTVNSSSSSWASQPYQDTQRTWLAVYAPGRCTALAYSMELQLHRKFRLTDSLDALPDGWTAWCWRPRMGNA